MSVFDAHLAQSSLESSAGEARDCTPGSQANIDQQIDVLALKRLNKLALASPAVPYADNSRLSHSVKNLKHCEEKRGRESELVSCASGWGSRRRS